MPGMFPPYRSRRAGPNKVWGPTTRSKRAKACHHARIWAEDYYCPPMRGFQCLILTSLVVVSVSQRTASPCELWGLKARSTKYFQHETCKKLTSSTWSSSWSFDIQIWIYVQRHFITGFPGDCASMPAPVLSHIEFNAVVTFLSYHRCSIVVSFKTPKRAHTSSE
jgi:hypothetical protein